MKKYKIAILDDYQQISLKMANWTALQARADVTVFHEHISNHELLVSQLKSFDVICIMRERTPMTRALLSALPSLRLIVSTGRRNASIDIEAAAELKIEVAHTGYLGHGAYELTWALLMAMARHIPTEVANIRNGGWQTTVGIDLKGKTIGIIGLGNLGSKIARIANVFDMKVLAWSENLTEEKAIQNGATLVNKEDIFALSDFITIHLILSDRSRGIVGKKELDRMKSSAFLINTSRGPLVDEQALIEVLKNKSIAGAALDVYDREPLSADHPFRNLNNVMATPHIGFVTEDTYKLFYTNMVEVLINWLDRQV